jgi:hypothetical protein
MLALFDVRTARTGLQAKIPACSYDNNFLFSRIPDGMPHARQFRAGCPLHRARQHSRSFLMPVNAFLTMARIGACPEALVTV